MSTKITLRINGKESHLSADTWQQNGGMDGYAKDYGDALQVRVKAKDGSTGFIPVTDWGNAKGQGYQLLTTYYGDTKPQQPSGVVDQPLNNGERRAQGISEVAQPISPVQPHNPQRSLQPSLTPDQQTRLSQQMTRFERWLNTDNVTPDTSKATSLIDAANKNLFGKMKKEEARRSHPIGKAYSMDEHGNVVENKPAEKYLLRTQRQQEDMVNESLRGISARYGKDVADKAIGIGNMKATNEALQSANEHINGISPVAGDTYGMQQWSGVANANRHTDPKAILSDATNILKGTFNNKQFIDNARAEAKRIGMDEQEYIKAAKENTSEQVKKDIYTKLIQSEMPKSHIDYIMRGLSNSIAGLVVGGINKTKGQREVAAIASQMTEQGQNPSFTPNFWDKLGSVSASFLADAPFFGVSGELSGQAIKGIAERQLTRLTATGMSKGAAQRVIASKMRSSFGARMADMVGKGAVGGGINLGTYNALHETARQLADQDIDIANLARETAKGIVTGAALGVGGGLTNAATYELSGLPKVLGKVGGFGTEGLIFTATGRALDGSDKSWVDDLASSYAQLAIMKLTSSPAKTLDNIANFRKAFDRSAGDRSGGLKFTAEEQNEIKQSTGGKGLVESLTGAEAYVSRWRDREAKDDVGKEGKGLVTLEKGERMKGEDEMIRKDLSDNYETLMRDKNISYSTKQKVRYLLGGKMDIYVPLASGYTTDSDGKTFTVTTNDKDGNRIEQRTFKSEQEANDYTDKLKEAIDKDAKSEKDYSAALAAYNDLIAQDGASEADIKKVIRGETTGDEQKDYAIKSRYKQLFSEYAKQQPRPTRNAEQPQENQGRIEGESVQPTEQPIGAQSKVPQNVEGNNDGLLKEQEAKGSDTGQTTLEETQANSYQNGYDAPDEQKNDVKRAYEKAQTQLASMLPDNMEEIENHPMDFVRDNPKFPTLSEEQKNAVYDYVQAKTSFDGMVHHVQDEMDARVTASDKEVDGRVSQVDGAIHPISLKTIDDNGQSKKAYIINGNVQMLPDGTMVDTEKSDKTIVIRDAVTGETSMIDPREILSMDDPIDAEKEKRTAADAIRQAYSKQEADKIDGVLPFAPGDTYAVVDGQGHPHNVSIVGDAVDEGTGQPIEGAVLATVDGQQAILPKDQIQAMSDAAKDATKVKRESIPYPFELNDEFVITTPDGRDVRGTITAGADSDGNVQIATDEPVNGQMVSVVSPDELSRSIKEYNGMTATQQEEAQPTKQSVPEDTHVTEQNNEPSQDISPQPENAMNEAQVEPTVVTQQDVAKDELPRDDDGNLVYDKVPVQKTIEDLYDGSLDDNEIKDFVDTNIKESNKAYKVLEKKAPKMGANKAKYLAAKKEWQSNLDEAKRKADYWKEVHAEQQRITNTTPDQVQEVQDEISGKNAVDELNANKEQVTFTSPLDMATQFVRGAKITPKSFQKETGLTTADQNKYVGMISNNGKSIERLGEELATMDDNENGGAFFHGDSNAARGAIIEALGEVRGKGGKKAQDMAEQDAAIAAYAQQRDNAFYENYGIGYEDYIAFEERFLPDMLRKYSNFDENDYNNTYADEIAAQLKQDESYGREPITEGEQPGNDTSVEVLQGSPSDDTGGVAVPGDEGRQVETGSNSDAQDGTVSEEPRGEVSQEADTFTPSPKKDGEDLFGYAERVIDEHKRKKEEENVDTNPTEAQKEAGNYKKGHIVVDGFHISIEQPKGSVRKGKDKDGNEWETLMHNTYGYIRGTESVDGDHIDIFLSDDPTEGNVYVVDQVKNDGTFDEHKVMYGFSDKESAKEAYLSNYSIGWKGLGNITEVSKENFKKWIDSSKRKTKPFADYVIANKENKNSEDNSIQYDKKIEENANTSTPEQREIGNALIDSIRKGGVTVHTDVKEMEDALSNLGIQLGGVQKMTVYHGSPYSFDQFDLSHVGEGEGAQAHGWGGYVALNRGTSEGYAELFKNRFNEIEDTIYKGEPINRNASLNEKQQKALILIASIMKAGRKLSEAKDLVIQKDEERKRKAFLSIDFYKGLIDGLKRAMAKKDKDWQSYKNMALRYEVDIENTKKSISEVDDTINFINSLKGGDVDYQERKSFIYQLEIPEDDGKNYLELEQGTNKNIRDRIADELVKRGYKETETDDIRYRMFGDIGFMDRTSNFLIYRSLEHLLGSQKAASKFLSDLGFTGLKYKGQKDGECAVIFNDKDMKIKDRIQLLHTKDGNVYGFVKDGEIYLDPTLIDANSPVHEYTHLWDAVVQNNNPELWKRGKDLMKQLPEWQKVLDDSNYADIKDNEDLVASEVHSRLSGAESERLFDEGINDSKKDGVFAEAEARTLIARVKKWLNEAWQWVKDTFTPWTKEEADKVSLKDFINMPIRDLLNGKKMPPVMGEKATIDKNDDIQYLIKEESSTGKPVSIDRVSVRGDYEKQIASGLYQFQEAMQDSMLGLKTLMMDIWKANGKEGHVFDIPGYENPYLLENAMSSANQAQAEIYGKMIIKPLIKAIAAFEGKGYKQDDVTDYMLAKHGLERNDYMRRKTAEEKLSESDYAKEIRKQERYLRTPGGKDDEAAKDKLANMKDQFDEMVIETMQGDDHDYSGITSLTKESDVWAAEEIARKMVNDFESNAGEEMTNNLWERTNDATKATLRKLYDSGLMTKANYEKVRDMYKNYVPLRGWDETTTEDVYTYMNHRDGAMRGSIMKKAEGRRSKADDPIATIEAMAEAGISQGNRNLMKQAFLNFVQNHPSDLVSVDDIWLKYNDVTEEWETVFPQLSNDDTAEDVRNKVEAFNQRMVELSNENPEKYKRGKDDVNIPYVVVPGTQSEHEILVRRGGRPYVMVINGNPRAAQAVNGLTNPDVEVGGAWGNILKGMEKVNRFISAMVTTRFPDFVASNFVRDAEYSNAMSWVKESPNYAARFGVNSAKNNPAMIGYLLNKFKKGSLDINDETQKMFQDFMMNGGETGYTIVRDIEAHKKKIHEEIRKANGKLPVKRAWQLLGEKFDDVNRSVENCARFNAFLTSRQFGRSVERAIWDAKEVSVNFNKKGAGARFLGTKGMTTMGNTGAFMSGVGRTGFIFWNAGVQGLYNSGGTTLRNPRKALSLMASLFLLGSIIPSLSGDGGDDDKNNYYNLPSAIRRTSICFRVGDVWLSIPLAIEYRALYGLGELATSVMSGNEKHDDKELVAEMVKQLTQIMPLDFMEGGGGYGTLVPSSVKPIYESIKNEDWTGLPLYKETPYNTNKPDWTKAYKNANKDLVDIAKGVSRATGGNDAKKGAVDVNPAEVENILEGYLGGAARTVNMLVKSGETMFANRDFEWRNVPIANRFIKGTGERTQLKAVKDRYYNYLDEFNETKRLEREYKNRADKGVLEYAEELNFLYNSKEYLRMTITEDFVKEIGKLNEQKNNADDDNERKAIESEQDMLMTEVVNILQQQEENK